MTRDNFPKKIVDGVAKRAGCQCSNPRCRRKTVGPSEKNSEKHSNIGKAAHITAAAHGGPRFNPNLTSAERKSITNAIHLCATCADLIDKNGGIDFPVELLVFWKKTNENEVWNELNNPRSNGAEKNLEKRGLAVLEEWNKSLSEGVYKNHFEIVELFCRWVIPFIQKNSDLQPLVAGWRNDYVTQIVENNLIQAQVLEEIQVAFRKIITAVENPTEQIRLKIDDIENILNGKPHREAYTSLSQYKKAYGAVKGLLQMLFNEGGRDLCSGYATFDTISRHIEKDGRVEIIQEEHIAEFTFSSLIERADELEENFTKIHLQNPVKVWSYFETALYFWNKTDHDMKESLEYLRKVNPLRAASERAAWREINLVKSGREFQLHPIIFTTELFMKGLRTIINEMIVASL